jgi:hypothetical protein
VDTGGGSVLNRLTLSFADGTRLDLEVMNTPVMTRINGEFLRVATGRPGP